MPPRKSLTHLDNAVMKFAEATSGLSTELATHTERLAAVQNMAEETRNDQKELRTQTATDFRFLNEKIESVKTDLSAQLLQHEGRMTTHLDAVTDRLASTLGATVASDRTEQKELAKRVTILERARYLIYGGAAVVVFIIVDVISNDRLWTGIKAWVTRIF